MCLQLQAAWIQRNFIYQIFSSKYAKYTRFMQNNFKEKIYWRTPNTIDEWPG